MTEEIVTQGGSMETGGQQTVSAPVSLEPAVSSPSSGDSSLGQLQSRMASGVFFDEGSGVVIDQSGKPIFDKDGKPYDSIASYKAQSAANPNGTNQQQGQTQQPARSQYQSDFNVNTVFESAPKFSGIQYRSPFSAQAQQQPAQQPQAAPAQPAQPLTPMDEIKAFRSKLHSERLNPIQQEFDAIIEKNPSLYDALFPHYNAKALAAKDAIEGEIQSKMLEIATRQTEGVRAQERQAIIVRDSEANIRSVASELWPGQGEKAFWDLVTGYEQADGKGGKQFVRGPAADLIDFLFDQSVGGQQLPGGDLESSYKSWWLNFSANKQNVQLVAKLANAMYVTGNLPKIRDAYRSAWESETGRRQSMQSAPIPNAGGAAPVPNNGQQPMSPELAKFLGRNVSTL